MMKRLSLRLGLAVLLLALTAEGASAIAWFSRGHGRAPEMSRVFVCHNYTCRMVTPVTFSPDDIVQIAGDLQGDTGSAEAERQAISQAVQTFEETVGARIGTSGDLPGMQFGRGTPGQMDCIDEATNTTALLVFLSAHGYLRYHTVREPASRGFFIDGRYPHATAVVSVNGNGAKWAIDSWPRANGEPPVIQPLAVWKRSRSGPES